MKQRRVYPNPPIRTIYELCLHDMMGGKPLTDAERGKIAEKIMDWGNLVFVGLAITQVFSGVPLTLVRVIIGAGALAGAYWIAIRLMKGGE